MELGLCGCWGWEGGGGKWDDGFPIDEPHHDGPDPLCAPGEFRGQVPAEQLRGDGGREGGARGCACACAAGVAEQGGGGAGAEGAEVVVVVC